MAAPRAAPRKTAPPWRTAAARTSSRISWLARKSSNWIGWYLGPDAAGRAEIRDAAFGRDAGAGERHDHAGRLDRARAGGRRVSPVGCQIGRAGPYDNVVHDCRTAASRSDRMPSRTECEARHAISAHHAARARSRCGARLLSATSSASRRCAAGSTTRTATRSCSWPRRTTRAWSPTSKKTGRDAPLVELTYNWDTEDYGEARYFGHLAFEVDDIYATCDTLMKARRHHQPPAARRQHGVRALARQALDRAPAEGRRRCRRRSRGRRCRIPGNGEQRWPAGLPGRRPQSARTRAVARLPPKLSIRRRRFRRPAPAPFV